MGAGPPGRAGVRRMLGIVTLLHSRSHGGEVLRGLLRCAALARSAPVPARGRRCATAPFPAALLLSQQTSREIASTFAAWSLLSGLLRVDGRPSPPALFPPGRGSARRKRPGSERSSAAGTPRAGARSVSRPRPSALRAPDQGAPDRQAAPSNGQQFGPSRCTWAAWGPPPLAQRGKALGGHPGRRAVLAPTRGAALRRIKRYARGPAHGLLWSARPSSALAGGGPPLVAARSLFRHGGPLRRALGGRAPVGSASARPWAHVGPRGKPPASTRGAGSPWPRALKFKLPRQPPGTRRRCGVGIRAGLVLARSIPSAFPPEALCRLASAGRSVILARSAARSPGHSGPVASGRSLRGLLFRCVLRAPLLSMPGALRAAPGSSRRYFVGAGPPPPPRGKRARGAVADLNCPRARMVVRASPRGRSAPAGARGLGSPAAAGGGGSKLGLDWVCPMWYNIRARRERSRGAPSGALLFCTPASVRPMRAARFACSALARACGASRPRPGGLPALRCELAACTPASVFQRFYDHLCSFLGPSALGGGFTPSPALPSGEGAPGVRGAAPLIVAAIIPLTDCFNRFVTVPGAWQTPGAGAALISGAALRASPPFP